MFEQSLVKHVSGLNGSKSTFFSTDMNWILCLPRVVVLSNIWTWFFEEICLVQTIDRFQYGRTTNMCHLWVFICNNLFCINANIWPSKQWQIVTTKQAHIYTLPIQKWRGNLDSRPGKLWWPGPVGCENTNALNVYPSLPLMQNKLFSPNT